MSFDIGEKVKVVAAKGDRGFYSYGHRISNVPLGSKGRVIAHDSCDPVFSQRVHIKNNYYLFSNEELDYYKDSSEVEEGNLEELLACESLQQDAEVSFYKRTKSKIKEFFRGKRKSFDSKSFDPKFNAREEFAVWIREQFPELQTYAEEGRDYEELNARKEEVYQAAKLACKHGIRTAGSCVGSAFKYHLKLLNGIDSSPFAIRIRRLVVHIEYFSANMNNSGSRHYGTQLKIRREDEPR